MEEIFPLKDTEFAFNLLYKTISIVLCVCTRAHTRARTCKCAHVHADVCGGGQEAMSPVSPICSLVSLGLSLNPVNPELTSLFGLVGQQAPVVL